MFNFNDKVALVTGATGNLGQAVASAFGAAGAFLVVTDRDQAQLDERYGGTPDCLAVAADLVDEASVAALSERALARFKRIDVLANVAGGFRMGPTLHETPTRDWDFMLDLNVRTVFNTCRAVIPQMLRQGSGRIVNVSARAAVQPKGRMAPYCASKAAVLTLTESLASEHKHTGININCILPGTIDTPQNRTDMPDADFSKWVSTTALADVILFLASDTARAVNGAAIPVYGES